MVETNNEIPGKMSLKRQERWDQILNAAERCFAQNGFHGAGISGIAQSSGMSVGHLYHYVENKESLIEAVIRRELTRHMTRLAELEHVEIGNVVDELVKKVSETILLETDIFRTVLNFETLAEAQRNPKVAEILQEHDALMRVRFGAILRRCGVADPETKTELIFTIFGGLPARAIRHPEQERGIVMETMMPVLRRILDPASEC